jgi:plasmid stabilization system protein ParE
MKIEVLRDAQRDLLAGYDFYERQSPGLGAYFLDSLFSDIDSLVLYAGIHSRVYGSHRCLSRRFPFAIYYQIENETVRVRAILDCRQRPARTQRRLGKMDPE